MLAVALTVTASVWVHMGQVFRFNLQREITLNAKVLIYIHQRVQRYLNDMLKIHWNEPERCICPFSPTRKKI